MIALTGLPAAGSLPGRASDRMVRPRAIGRGGNGGYLDALRKATMSLISGPVNWGQATFLACIWRSIAGP